MFKVSNMLEKKIAYNLYDTRQKGVLEIIPPPPKKKNSLFSASVRFGPEGVLI
jgi:hypothetical protein